MTGSYNTRSAFKLSGNASLAIYYTILLDCLNICVKFNNCKGRKGEYSVAVEWKLMKIINMYI